MKILFINNFRGIGGGEEFLRDILPSLARKGAYVGLVCKPGSPLAEMFHGSDIAIYPINRSGKGFISSVFKMASIIRQGRYEIINIQRGHDIIQSWIAALLSGKRPKLMYTVQVAEFKRSRFLLSRLHAIVAVSRYIRSGMTAFAPAIASKTRVINYGIAVAGFDADSAPRGFLRKRFSIAKDTTIIGTVGDLWKNQIEFLDALVEIRKEIPDTRFALVAAESGIGQVNAFKQRVKELGLEDAVIWAGRLSKDDMRAFYADIDVAISTHRNEGFGIWILEAMAMGNPVIAFNDGGIRDSLEGCPAGVLVEGGPKEMAAEILRPLNDAGTRRKMVEAGPRWVAEKFSRERMVNDYYAYFNAVISEDAK